MATNPEIMNVSHGTTTHAPEVEWKVEYTTTYLLIHFLPFVNHDILNHMFNNEPVNLTTPNTIYFKEVDW